jgi:hypothetical protein
MYTGEAMNDTICGAITLRRLIELEYRGTRRVVEAHAHGVSSDGVEVVVTFQRSGESRSGNPVGWKALHVADIHGIVVLETTFEPRDGYQPGGRSDNLAEVHCCI